MAGGGVSKKPLVGSSTAKSRFGQDSTCAAFVAVVALVAAMLAQSSCGLISRTVATGGEMPLKAVPPPKIPHLRMIVFALDGTPRDQFMALVRSGKAPNITRLLGDEEENGLFEHGYADPDALSMLPTSTVADWSAILTGEPPGRNGVTGDEWFERDNTRFFAPVPISVTETTDLQKAITDGLIGNELRVPTLYQQLGVESNVSLLWIYRGATLYTTVGPSSFTGLIASALAGTLNGDSAEKSISGAMDLDSVSRLTAALEAHGIPNLQIVYFPGIDSFTHLSPNPLPSQLGYLEVGSSRVDLQACKLEYSIVSPK